ILKIANTWLILNAGGGPTDDKPTVTLTTPPDPNRTSAFLNIRVADIARAYKEWSAKGAQFLTEPKDHGREIRAYIRDPDGHLMRWGDPAAGFVGNPDGRIQRYTGYGVYYQPVALAAMLAGANVVEAGSGLYGSPVPPAHIYQAVLDGHPVVAWISNTYHQVDLAWYVAYDGATVRYTLTEHAVTIIGVRR